MMKEKRYFQIPVQQFMDQPHKTASTNDALFQQRMSRKALKAKRKPDSDRVVEESLSMVIGVLKEFVKKKKGVVLQNECKFFQFSTTIPILAQILHRWSQSYSKGRVMRLYLKKESKKRDMVFDVSSADLLKVLIWISQSIFDGHLRQE